MSFQKELKAVLDVEREGRTRLEEATEEAERIVAKARDQAQALLRDGEKRIARKRQQLIAETDRAIERSRDEIRQRSRLEEKRLRALARKNREEALRRILAWLWGEA